MTLTNTLKFTNVKITFVKSVLNLSSLVILQKSKEDRRKTPAERQNHKGVHSGSLTKPEV